jgi:hypothetical protein
MGKLRPRVRAALAAGLALAAVAIGLGPAAAASDRVPWQATELYPVAPGVGHPGIEGYPDPGLDGLACTGPGDCLAVGSYPRRNHQLRPALATETEGQWTSLKRLWLPRTAANPAGLGQLNAIACPSPRWCAAVGGLGAAGQSGAFVITESDGVWGRARLVRLPPNHDAGRDAELDGLTCLRPGSCLAVGWYFTSSFAAGQEPLAVRAVTGRWQQATEVAAPPSGGDAGSGGYLSSVSCPSAAQCVAVGSYQRGLAWRGLQAVWSGGRWHRPTAMTPPPHPFSNTTQLTSVSCPTARFCLAVGSYLFGFGSFSVLFADGHWQRARTLTVAPRGSSGPDLVTTVDCLPAVCLAGGTYGVPNTTVTLAYVVTFARGQWQDPVRIRLPRNAASLFYQYPTPEAVSCVSSTSCTAVGVYTTRRGPFEAFSAAGPA